MTEKNYNPEQKQKRTREKMEKIDKNIKKNDKIIEQKQEIKKESVIESKDKTKEIENKEGEIKKEEKKKIKKIEAVVNGLSLPVSSKQSFAICKFIKNKEIGFAIKELEEILMHKKALPMKGEIPHRRGKIMSGRYPKNSITAFIKLLKSLNANSSVNEMSNPIISKAYANFASRPYGKFGRVRKKRTNVTIIATEKKTEDKK